MKDELIKVNEVDFFATKTITLTAYMKKAALVIPHHPPGTSEELTDLYWQEVQGLKKKQEAPAKIVRRSRVGGGPDVGVVDNKKRNSVASAGKKQRKKPKGE